jgi:hypothetical protein
MIELFVISTQMLLANLFLWNRCAPRRYSIVTTIGIYAFFRLILVGAGELLNSLYLDAPLIIFAGFLYIIPIFFLYETKLLKMINIFFFLWIYTFSLYSISYFLFFTLPGRAAVEGLLGSSVSPVCADVLLLLCLCDP